MAALPAAASLRAPALPPRAARSADAAPSGASTVSDWESAIDAAAVAKEFPQAAVSGQVFLDSAATTLKPTMVLDTMDKFYRTQYATVHRGMYPQALRATDRFHGARGKVQRLINARFPDEVIFTRGCTEGINLVAGAVGEMYVNSGDEVVVTESEHHSNLVPWQMLCAKRGAQLRVVPVTDAGGIDVQAFHKALSPRTRIVALQHRSNVTGVMHPVSELAALAKARGARVVLDAAQSAQSPDLDVQRLGVDFVAFSGHKMFGPSGIGVLWGKREVMQTLPPPHGGGDMVDHVDWNRTTFAPLPQRWEAGTPPIAEAIGLGAACDWLQRIGRKKLDRYLSGLGAYTRRLLKDVSGVKMLPSNGSVVTFTVSGASALDTATLLGASGFSVRAGHHCCQPLHRRFGLSSSVRVSLGPWNSKKDVDAFTVALKTVLRQLRTGAVKAGSGKPKQDTNQ